jgi:hypothetical protein
MTKTPKHYWNYRILTSLPESGQGIYENLPEKIKLERIFWIAEVHYDKGKPTCYGVKDLLSVSENVLDLKWAYDKIAEAFTKPILDADKSLIEFKEN